MTIIYYPVGALLEKALQIFTKVNHTQDFQDSLAKGLNSNVKLEISDGPVTDVAALNSANQIVIHENFCQFYWCLCFSSLTFYDKGILEPLTKSSFIGKIDFSNEDTKIAFKVFEAGVGLLNPIEKITPRHTFFELPNPHNNTSHDYVGLASSIFCYGIAFILHHEYSHFTLNHSFNGSKEDEEEADSGAYWSVMLGAPEEEQKTAKLGIITALSALILLDSSLEGGEYHPDSDSRLQTVFHNFDSEDDNYWGLACLTLKMWAFHYDRMNDFPHPEECDTWQDYFNIIMTHLEITKSQ